MASPLPPDPYAALGVSKGASAGEIKKAHRLLVLKYHPDKLLNASEEEKGAASNRFVLIQTSYEILSEPARRERYDAQVRLAELRKQAMNRQKEDHPRSRGADTRSASSPHKSQDAPRSAYAGRQDPRMTPQYEERRPSYAADYFDPQPRSTMRKEPDYEQPSRRSQPDHKEQSRTSARSTKDDEKDRRREKARQAERDTRRDRDRKYSTPAYVDEDSDSDLDERERVLRKSRDEESERRTRDAYYAQMHRQRKEAEEGNYDDRTRKMFAQAADIRDYIARGGARQRPEQERRPSPVRMASSKEKVEYVRRGGEGRAPVMVRRSSGKPEKSSKESSKDKESSRKASSRTPERRSSTENVEKRQPPNLKNSKSTPANIKLPTEKTRAASLQPGTDAMPTPSMKRSETMPTQNSARRSENTAPKASGLRATEFKEGVPTPATTPEYQQGPAAPKYSYGRQYADDDEYATPDRYRTEVREPAGASQRPRYTRKVTRSPSPVKDSRESAPREHAKDSRESMRGFREPAKESRDQARDTRDPRANTHRTASARPPSTQPQPPPLNTRTTSTSYVYGRDGVSHFEGSRPSSGREPSPREPSYKYERPQQPPFGDVGAAGPPPSGSPRHRYGPCVPPEAPPAVYPTRTYQPEDIRVQSGYSTKRQERPILNRNGSGNRPYSHAQPIRVP